MDNKKIIKEYIEMSDGLTRAISSSLPGKDSRKDIGRFTGLDEFGFSLSNSVLLSEDVKNIIKNDAEGMSEIRLKRPGSIDDYESGILEVFKHHGVLPSSIPFSVGTMAGALKKLQKDDGYAGISKKHAAVIEDLALDQISLKSRLISPNQIIDFISDTSKSLTERSLLFNALGLDRSNTAREFLLENKDFVSREFYDVILNAHGDQAYMGKNYIEGYAEDHFEKMVDGPTNSNLLQYMGGTSIHYSYSKGYMSDYSFDNHDAFRRDFENLPPEVQASYIGKNPQVHDLIEAGIAGDSGKNFARTLVSSNPSLISALPPQIVTEELLFKAVSSSARKDLSFLSNVDERILSPRVVEASIRDDINNSNFMPERALNKDILIQCFLDHGKMPDDSSAHYMSIVAAMNEVSSSDEEYATSDQHRLSINEWNLAPREYEQSPGNGKVVVDMLNDLSRTSMEKARLFHSTNLENIDPRVQSLDGGQEIKKQLDELALEYNMKHNPDFYASKELDPTLGYEPKAPNYF